MALYEMKIVIIGEFPDATKAAIRSNFPADWELAIVKPNMVRQEIHDADVIIPEHIRIDADFLSQAPRLKLVQTGVGYDNVDIDACRNKGVQVCNAAGVNANAVAEHVMAFILNWYKNITRLDNFMKSSAASKQLEYCGSELEGKTIGIIGFGAIGKRVADFCTAFHMKVLAFNRSPISAPDVKQVELDTLYMQSDIVSIHLPLYEETRHMIGADAFAKMKSDALLINTSRGGIINENALVKALKQHEIGGACLDVYEQEPLSGSSPLRQMKNVLLTPHTAGLPDGVKYHRKRYAFFASQIEKICAGKQPENLLT